ncbi:hypothetical protein BJV77DRAFT_966229 [Russula vinacea]|nr:hypothetical protein BJV77DRAFT_966229 [Russula vinacea]
MSPPTHIRSRPPQPPPTRSNQAPLNRPQAQPQPISPVSSQPPHSADDEDPLHNDPHWYERDLTPQRRKRGPELLQDALEDELYRKKHRGHARSEKEDHLKAFKKAGQWIVRIYGPWLDLNQAFRLGLAEDGIFDIETTEDDHCAIRDADDTTNRAYIHLYHAVLAQVPNFKKTIDKFGDNFESIMSLINLMEKESQSARQQDTNKMKHGMQDYFTYDPQTMRLLPVPREKSGRGFNHLGTARALCPRVYIYAFNHDETFLNRLTSSEIRVTANQFPNFLYNESEAELLLEENLEEWNVEKGLLQSSLCLWAFKCIFMGNGFWMATDKKKKAGISKINGLTHITPSTIAYAVTQAHFALLSFEEWGAEDGQFMLQEFYQIIMELFEDEEDEWVLETLAWWNQKIFPDNGSSKGHEDEDDVLLDSSLSRSMAKQAQLKCAALRHQIEGE